MKNKLNKLKTCARSCPICSGKKGEILYTQNFLLPPVYPLPSSYDIVCCLQCGFVHADTSVTQKEYSRFYSQFSKYEDKTTASGGREQSYDNQRLTRTAQDVENILPNKSCSILDIGCGNGGLLSVLRDKGYRDLTGLDPSPVCVSHVREQNINAFLGGIFPEDFQENNMLNEQFDCIILSHVLEHIYDVKKAMGSILKWLKTDGILYIEVPDAARYAEFYLVPYYCFDIEHINHFSGNSLKNLVENHGCEVVACHEKNNPMSNTSFYPAVSIACRKTMVNQKKNIIPEFNTRDAVLQYIELSKNAKRSSELERLCKDKKDIIVWGVGNYLFRLLGNSALNECRIVGFIDSDVKKQGLRIRSIPVHPPSRLKDFNGTVVVCAAFHHDEIVTQLQEMQVDNSRIVVL